MAASESVSDERVTRRRHGQLMSADGFPRHTRRVTVALITRTDINTGEQYTANINNHVNVQNTVQRLKNVEINKRHCII
jgi:hypothetical protein